MPSDEIKKNVKTNDEFPKNNEQRRTKKKAKPRKTFFSFAVKRIEIERPIELSNYLVFILKKFSTEISEFIQKMFSSFPPFVAVLIVAFLIFVRFFVFSILKDFSYSNSTISPT